LSKLSISETWQETILKDASPIPYEDTFGIEVTSEANKAGQIDCIFLEGEHERKFSWLFSSDLPSKLSTFRSRDPEPDKIKIIAERLLNPNLCYTTKSDAEKDFRSMELSWWVNETLRAAERDVHMELQR
jgi:hypothetical protein